MKIKAINLITVPVFLFATACSFTEPANRATGTVAPTKAVFGGVSTTQTVDSSVPSGLTAEDCLKNTSNNPMCKDCCDCLSGSDAQKIKSCRDACAQHDFGQNSGSLAFTASSELGSSGDFSLFTASGTQKECKRLCDSSTTLACGDRRFCRDACNKLTDSDQLGGASTPTLNTPVSPQAWVVNPPPITAGGGKPPEAAIQACDGKSEQAACEFTSQKGTETGVCETVQGELACSPQRRPHGGEQTTNNGKQPEVQETATSSQAYNIKQAISDKAQGMTIAFDTLAFMTGDLGADSFFPPGKVADFWGFQYLRDNDPSQMGHTGDFLTNAAMNMLNTLTEAQRAQLIALAKNQVSSIQEYAYRRFVLMQAFRRLASGDLPSGMTGLSEDAVKAYSAELYALDGQISFERAQLMGSLLNSLDKTQLSYLNNMAGKGMLEWPLVEEPSDIQRLDRDVKIAVMTYAADMFSWYAGSAEADVYFCPERHGTYFGSFYLKDAPAMNNSSYAIPTNLTGDMGENLFRILTPDQAQLITSLVDIQEPYLKRIVETRTAISTELRKFKSGGSSDSATVAGLMQTYGELDGEIVYNLAVHFVQVFKTLTDEQKSQLMALRKQMLGDQLVPSGAYLYSEPIAMPQIPNTDFLFK